MKRGWLAPAALALATLSCQLLLGLEEPSGTAEAPPPEEDAGEDPADPCDHALAPEPPAKDDDLDTKGTYWFAAQSVIVPLSQTDGPPGFDLDDACTCKPDRRDGGPSCVSSKTACDLDRGIDDSLGATLAEVSRFSPAGDAIKPVNQDLQQGSRTLLVYLTDYNGKANDTDVRVAFVNSGGLYTNVGCDGAARPLEVTYGDVNDDHTPRGKDRYRPAFDGCDHWAPEEGSFGTSGRAPSILTKGYVSDHRLVVRVDEVATAIFGNRATIHSVLFVAKIAGEGSPLRLEGVLAGRMPFEDLVQSLGGNQSGEGYDDGGYPAACEQGFWGLLAVPRLCAARDIMAASSEDFLGRPCDAVSINLGFVMVEARLAEFDFTNKGQKKSCPPVACP